MINKVFRRKHMITRALNKTCQRIIDIGAVSKVNKIQIDKCSYLLDSFEIGERKYIELRRVFAS